MKILKSEIEGYLKLKDAAEKILTECQNLTDFKKANNALECNLAKDYAEIYLLLKEFKRVVLNEGETSEIDYIFRVGVLDGRISDRVAKIQRAANYDINLYNKVQEFLIAKSEIFKYLKNMID